MVVAIRVGGSGFRFWGLGFRVYVSGLGFELIQHVIVNLTSWAFVHFSRFTASIPILSYATVCIGLRLSKTVTKSTQLAPHHVYFVGCFEWGVGEMLGPRVEQTLCQASERAPKVIVDDRFFFRPSLTLGFGGFCGYG